MLAVSIRPEVVASRARIEDASIKCARTGIDSTIAFPTWAAVIEDAAAVPTAAAAGGHWIPKLPNARTFARVGRVATVREPASPAAGPRQESHEDG
jgi:hypothetical protein